MAISPQRPTIYLYSAYRAVIFAIAQLSCYIYGLFIRSCARQLEQCCGRIFTNFSWVSSHWATTDEIWGSQHPCEEVPQCNGAKFSVDNLPVVTLHQRPKFNTTTPGERLYRGQLANCL